MKMVKEFYPDADFDSIYKYPPFILEIVTQVVGVDFEYSLINADFSSCILLENEPIDSVVYRICNREYVKKERHGFQLPIDQQARFLCEMAIEEKGKITPADFPKVLENIGVRDRVEEVVKGLIDHPLLLKTNGDYVFRFEFFNTHFKSIAIFNLLCTDIELKLTDRLISILVQDCNFNSVISKTLVQKAYNCKIPFLKCLKYSKIVITRIIEGATSDNLQDVYRRKKAISNILLVIFASKHETFSNEEIISKLFGENGKDINHLCLIDIPHFAHIEFDFSGFYFSNCDFINYNSFFNCKFDKDTFFDETCLISNIPASKVNLKNIQARDYNFDKRIKGDNSVFRVLKIKDNPDIQLTQFFREYLGLFFIQRQFLCELPARSVSIMKDDFVTPALLTRILAINEIVVKWSDDKITIDEKLKSKIYKFLTQGLLFPQLSRSINELKNKFLDN